MSERERNKDRDRQAENRKENRRIAVFIVYSEANTVLSNEI